MTWLDYHRLLYFWTVVSDGGLTAGSRAPHQPRKLSAPSSVDSNSHSANSCLTARTDR